MTETKLDIQAFIVAADNYTGPSVVPYPVRIRNNPNNEVSPCAVYQRILQEETCDILVYLHSDLTIHDPTWMTRLEAIFTNPNCVVAGLGGATALGHPDIYRKPYELQQLARYGYASNQSDWQVHGSHEAGIKRVAVLDAFLLAVRRDWLLDVGGWPTEHLTFHCLDTWLACEAARQGKETWMVGVPCHHAGGGTSVTESYAKAKWLQGNSVEEDHRRPHAFLYHEYRDVLPLRVPE